MGKIVGLTFELAEKAEKFDCPHCGKAYKSAETLERHIREKHPEPAGTQPDAGSEE